MLESGLSPVEKTAIMYRTALSYAQLKIYINLLEKKAMLKQDEDANWLTTDKGKEFLKAYQAVSQLIK